MVKAIRAGLERELDSAGRSGRPAHHAGLLLDYYLREIVSGKKAAQEQLYKTVCGSKPSDLYRRAFERWRQLHEADGERTVTRQFQADGRLIVGLGSDSVREVGITLHRNYGVPLIPGSALKGLARAYTRWWLEGHEAFAKEDYACLTQTLFGQQELAGYIAWHDAWYIPASAPQDQPLALDVMTPHHPRYYTGSGSGRSWPSDFDDPTPVHFLSARGSYLVALTGPNRAWAIRAMDLLTDALAGWGVGGKTSSGYGHLDAAGVTPDASKGTPAQDKASATPEHPMLLQIRSLTAANVAGQINNLFQQATTLAEPVRGQALQAIWDKLDSSTEMRRWSRGRAWVRELKAELGIEEDDA